MSMKDYLKLCILSMCVLLGFSISLAYSPGSWDQEVIQKIDQSVEDITETGGKERLGYVLTILIDRAEEVEDERSLFLLEYVLRRINISMEENFGFPIVRDALYEGAIDMSGNGETGIDSPGDTSENPIQENASDVSDLIGGSQSLEDFYATYKGKVTSTAPISTLCTQYYDKIDEVAKEYDFPTAVIVATWYREHTCKFSNPSNGWGNFQITSHSYPPGEITWADFENQIINFIYFSRAKREWYDTFQKYGREPVKLAYDEIDLTSLRKHAILYNGVVGTLTDNIYANQNFGTPSDGRDGIVVMTLRALGWQLEQDRTGLLYDRGTMQEEDIEEVTEEIVKDIADEVVEEIVEEMEEEIVEEVVDEVVEEVNETSAGCDTLPFTENLGPDANHPQVLALQNFLQDQGLYSGEPNGVYDERTTEAVNAFQAFYKSEILDPGGYTAPTGYRYPATRRKANELACE